MQARWLNMEEAAAVHESLCKMGDQMRSWAFTSASFAEEAQRIEQFLDGARARIEALAAQVQTHAGAEQGDFLMQQIGIGGQQSGQLGSQP